MKWGQTHGGKGDVPRPTNKKKFDDNFDRIFGSKRGTGILEGDKNGANAGSKSKEEDSGAAKSS